MIPKIVHYCWFGLSEKPLKIQRCINSWQKHLPDYTFQEWNESNFDIHCSGYVEQAYQQKKYAFVSDIARIKALQTHGGIYMDTDVLLFKSFNDILPTAQCILGFEYDNWVATSFMACEKNHPILHQFEQSYHGEKFIKPDGKLNYTTNVFRLTRLLQNMGLTRVNTQQKLSHGITVYPIEYFSPYDYANCILEKTNNSYCAHLFFVTWLPATEQIKKLIKKVAVKLIGKHGMQKLRETIWQK